MNNPEGFRDFKGAARLVREGKRFVIGGHPMMDGDAIGSVLAFYNALKQAGHDCLAVTQDVGAGKYAFLHGADEIQPLAELPESLEGYDTAIIVDCGAQSRARAVLDRLAPGTKVVNIDHHIDNPGFGDAAVVIPDASSSGEVALQVLKEAGIAINKAAAEALFTAVVTDTGRFSFSNSTPLSYRMVADLVEEHGLDVATLAGNIYRTKSPQRLKLEAMVADSIELHLDGKLVVARVTQEMLTRTGCTEAEASEMIVIPKSLKDGMVCILFREVTDDHVKVSLRSEGQMPVNDLAAQFRGGGHLRAAGCQVVGQPVADSEAAITKAAIEQLQTTLAKTGGKLVV